VEKIKVPAHQFVPNQRFPDIGRNPIRKAEFAKCSWCAKKDIQASFELYKSDRITRFYGHCRSEAGLIQLCCTFWSFKPPWFGYSRRTQYPHTRRTKLTAQSGHLPTKDFWPFAVSSHVSMGNPVSIAIHVTYHVLTTFHPGAYMNAEDWNKKNHPLCRF
jgi:hypothetical protein